MRAALPFKQTIELVQVMGSHWLLRRATYVLSKKSGLLRRRFPAASPGSIQLSDAIDGPAASSPQVYRSFRESSPARFIFPAGQLPMPDMLWKLAGPASCERTLAVADDYCSGRFLYYNHHVCDLGDPVDWLLNPFTGFHHHTQTHWCNYSTFSAEAGDIKDIWEPSRFACAYWLVRAYALTSNRKYPATFWNLFDSWCAQNPPNLGPNWKCGQETALRLMAWCFGLYGFWSSPESTAERIASMAILIALHADRIAGNIDYAISQKNNHAISEAVGLITAGMLFPEMKNARRWLAIGRRVFDQEVLRQIYADGSYVQHSMNYHRVMLHNCLWAIRLAQLNAHPFDPRVTTRINDASWFLFQMLDHDSGHTPNYGPSDGAMLLPLSGEDYLDYRPTVQAGRFMATGRRVLPAGPWDETLLWLFGGAALDQPLALTAPTSHRFDQGGYYTLRTKDSWCMIRCHTYCDRPTHVDPLHVDLWHKGVNVLADGGTYKYYDPSSPHRERFFKDIHAHNTIAVDRTGPLEQLSRFMWVPWPAASCLLHRADHWVGEHYGYRRAPGYVVHRRSVTIEKEASWLVTDELLGRGAHTIHLRWRLAPAAVELDRAGRCVTANMSCGRITLLVGCPQHLTMEVYEGFERQAMLCGWASQYYGERHAVPTVVVTGSCKLPVCIETRIRFGSDA